MGKKKIYIYIFFKMLNYGVICQVEIDNEYNFLLGYIKLRFFVLCKLNGNLGLIWD